MKTFLVVALVMITPATAHAEDWYVVGVGGGVVSSQTSNADEIEFGSEFGYMVGVEGGYAWEAGQFTFSVGPELSYTEKALHGQNGHGKMSADGNDLRAVSGMLNAQAAYRVYTPFSVYALGGLGGAGLWGLGDSDMVPAWQVEGGLALDLSTSVQIMAGYRYKWQGEACLDDNCGDMDLQGPMLRVRYRF